MNSYQEENKKIQEILSAKGWFSDETLHGILARYNPETSLLEWLPEEYLTSSQIIELKEALELPEETQMRLIQVSKKKLEKTAILPPHEANSYQTNPQKDKTLVVEPSSTSQRISKKYLSKEPEEPKEKLGSYEILERIGKGGMGQVFKANHIFLDKIVALKILDDRILEEKGVVKRFFREAQATGMLEHPNIIRCLDAGIIEGKYFLVMDYVQGETIDSLLEDKPFSVKQALKIALEILSALKYAESFNMVHRDLKPANIMISPKMEIKLLDFGLAKFVGEATAVTVEGTLLGTPLYMSPEQCRGELKITIAADIYALGATLYHMLAGRPPFQGASPLIILNQHLISPVPPLKEKAPHIPDPICNLIEKMMAKPVEDRYQHPEEVIQEIEKFIHPKENPTAPPSTSKLNLSPKIGTGKIGKKPSMPTKPLMPPTPSTGNISPPANQEDLLRQILIPKENLPLTISESSPTQKNKTEAMLEMEEDSSRFSLSEESDLKSIDHLITELSSFDDETRKLAREKLASERNKQIYFKIRNMVEDQEFPFIDKELTEQKELLKLLALNGEEDSSPVFKSIIDKKVILLKREVAQKHLNTKKCAIRALAYIKGKRVIELLKQVQQSRNQELAVLAQITLAELEKAEQ